MHTKKAIALNTAIAAHYALLWEEIEKLKREVRRVHVEIGEFIVNFNPLKLMSDSLSNITINRKKLSVKDFKLLREKLRTPPVYYSRGLYWLWCGEGENAVKNVFRETEDFIRGLPGAKIPKRPKEVAEWLKCKND